jgi:putative ABC transport system ATP-binding protein
MSMSPVCAPLKPGVPVLSGRAAPLSCRVEGAGLLSLPMSQALLQFRDVTKVFGDDGDHARTVLSHVSLDLDPGETVAIVGRSGSGKSTFLHLAAGIEVPTSGRIVFEGRDLAGLSEHERTLVRRSRIGLVFQFFHLLPHLTVLENVALPAWIAGARQEKRAEELLERVGLRERAEEVVQKLSGGEMQRVAICRALLSRPRLLLADEPTGNLDDANSRVVMDLLLRLVSEERGTLVYATHSLELAALAHETWRIHDGSVGPA